jgi:hypothetical protein
MNESSVKDIANQQMPLYTALAGFVSKTNFVNIGVITRVHSENYVDVRFYYKSSAGRNVQIQAVRLLHLGTTKCKLLITPAVGDNVLLLCPKDFIEKIEYNRVPQQSKNVYLPYGNTNMCGILIKDESDDNVKTTVGINENGDVSVTTEGNITIESEGDLSVSSEGDVSVSASNVTAICSSFSVKGSEDGNPVFEVKP